MRARSAGLVSTLALAAALLACGGGGEEKSDFTAEADASCGPGNTALAAVARPANAEALASPTSLATAARFLTAYLPIEEKLFADIKALVVPRATRRRWPPCWPPRTRSS